MLVPSFFRPPGWIGGRGSCSRRGREHGQCPEYPAFREALQVLLQRRGEGPTCSHQIASITWQSQPETGAEALFILRLVLGRQL